MIRRVDIDEETRRAILVAQQTCAILVDQSERYRAADDNEKADAALAQVELILAKLGELQAAFQRPEIQ